MGERPANSTPESNPYASPTTEVVSAESPEADVDGGYVTAQTVALLAQTRPWLNVYFAVGMLWLGLLLLLAAPAILSGHPTGRLEGLAAIGLDAVFCGLPLLFMWRYGARIASFVRAPDQARLGEVLVAGRSFWQCVGILLLLLILLAILVVAGSVLFFIVSSRVDS